MYNTKERRDELLKALDEAFLHELKQAGGNVARRLDPEIARVMLDRLVAKFRLWINRLGDKR